MRAHFGGEKRRSTERDEVFLHRLQALIPDEGRVQRDLRRADKVWEWGRTVMEDNTDGRTNPEPEHDLWRDVGGEA
jgi:hypothetical protein